MNLDEIVREGEAPAPVEVPTEVPDPDEVEVGV